MTPEGYIPLQIDDAANRELKRSDDHVEPRAEVLFTRPVGLEVRPSGSWPPRLPRIVIGWITFRGEVLVRGTTSVGSFSI